MREEDLGEATRIFRVAFGTFLGLADPGAFIVDRDYVTTRLRANGGAALSADVHGQLAGSNFATLWSSFGFFGPLSVAPQHWGNGVAKELVGATMDFFRERGVRDAGLFTFPQSIKHLGLYQKFGFWPGFLTGILTKPVLTRSARSWTPYSPQAAADCSALTDSIYAGLDVGVEIRAVADQGLGETVLVWGGDLLEAFAVCHCGAGTEAGAGNCYIKFAAVRPGSGIDGRFDRLLDGCEAMAASRGLQRIEVGVNFERLDAYGQLMRRGYRLERTGLAMHWNSSRAYNRRDTYVLDDWR